MRKIILASGSPRRKELLEGLDFNFEVRLKQEIQENFPSDIEAEVVPEYLSRVKASAYLEDLQSNEIVITADTVVICDGSILGKPSDAKEAAAMLHKISGKTHQVTTGVCITSKEKQVHIHVNTFVTFKELTDREINYYIDKYKPFDKAGAYGIQEWIGYIGCTKLEGDYYNVMGLPIYKVYKELQNF
jgi:septum formation protein